MLLNELNLKDIDLTALTSEQLKELEKYLTPKLTKFIPHIPTPKQAAFLLLEDLEAFYGGAASGGKSDALLMAALQHVDTPGYSAILFRRTYSDLSLPGSLMDRASEWLAPYINSGEVRWIDKLKTYIFSCPGGGTSTLSFGYLETDGDKYRYQGSEFQFIGYDEVTQLLESCYRYLFSRLRRVRGVTVPLRIRGASNPGGTGHAWVRNRFLVEGPSKGRVFIAAKMDDNPHIDAEEYEKALSELDPVTRAQLRSGDWEVRTEGSLFDRSWFKIISRSQIPIEVKKVRFWDCAATEVSQRNKNPDYTAGALLSEYKGIYYLEDIIRVRKRPGEVEALIKRTAEVDGIGVSIHMEMEPGGSGVAMIDHYAREVLKGFAFKGIKSTGSKVIRAHPVSTAAEGSRIYVIEGAWNQDFFDEIEAFPNVDHDDQVDAVAGAFLSLKTNLRVIGAPIGLMRAGGSKWDEDSYS